MIFIYKDREYEVEIIKKNNKNTYVRVRDGKIYVTTNYFTCSRTIDKLLKDNCQAIGKMIDRAEKREEKKLEGKKRMDSGAFLRGYKLEAGEKLLSERN